MVQSLAIKVEMDTHYRCKKCRVIGRVEELVNRPWTGWRNGDLVKVPNLCCPDCGSNDLLMRAPGVDQ